MFKVGQKPRISRLHYFTFGTWHIVLPFHLCNAPQRHSVLDFFSTTSSRPHQGQVMVIRIRRVLQGLVIISSGMTGLDLLPGDTGRPMQSAAIRTTLTNTRKRPDRAAHSRTAPGTGQIKKAPAMGLTVQTRIVCDRSFFRCFFLFCHFSAFQKKNSYEHRHVDQGAH